MDIIKITVPTPKKLIEEKLGHIHNVVNSLVDEIKENEKDIAKLQNMKIAYEDALKILEEG